MNKRLGVSMLLCLALAVAGCGQHEGEHAAEPLSSGPAPAQPAPAADVGTALARIEPTSGSAVTGTATFTVEQGQVTLNLELRNCPPGEHAFHIHETGDCSAPDGSSAGGHWNPTAEAHGRWGESPYHLGDVGNLVVGEDGMGSISLTTDAWSIGTGQPSDIVGRAVIVHAAADDFATQPTGAAGGRIACGVIE